MKKVLLGTMRYRIDTRKLTFSDLRVESSFPLALLYWLITRLPIKLPCSTSTPAVDSLQPYLISKHDVTAEIKEVFHERAEELARQGFKGTLYHRIEDPMNHTTIHYGSFLHKSTQVIARLSYRVFRATTPHKTYNHIELISYLEDGGFAITTTSPEGDHDVDSVTGICLPSAKCEELCLAHLDLLKSSQVRSRPVKLRDGQHLLDIEEDLHHRQTQHLVDRRLFVQAPEEVLAETEQSVGQVPPMTAGESADGLTENESLLLAEIRKIEDKPNSSWEGLLLVLAVSIGFFIAAGGLVWDWHFTFMLVPILLFHELGHFMSMKLFDYNNVRMFFIPLFGAAVTGRHYNVPGWKKIVTSLMGPVPGILLGTAIGAVAIVNQQDFLLEPAILLLALNGFNLLPSLPLDGGWVMHGLLFSRHAFLDFLFRLLAIGLLLFLAAIGGGKLFMFLGIALAVALPMSFHTARISDRLRATGGFADKGSEGHIPPAAVKLIAGELDRTFPKGMDTRAKAKVSLQIFENVNSTPPGWITSLTLGMVYVCSIGLTIVAGSIFFLAKHADLPQLLADAALGPKRELVLDEIQRFPSESEPADFVADEVLVVDFPEREQAELATKQLKVDLPDNSNLLLVGSTLFVPLKTPDMLEKKELWFDQFETEDNRVFLCTDNGNHSFSMQFIMPSFEAAEQLDAELNRYFTLPNPERFVAPWHPLELNSDQLLARDTVRKLINHEWLDDEDTDIETFEEIATAARRGQKQKVEDLQRQMQERQIERFEAYVQELRLLPKDSIDGDILESYEFALKDQAERPADEESIWDTGIVPPDAETWLSDYENRLGLLPEGSEIEESAKLVSAKYGYAAANGMSMNLTVSFQCLPTGLLTFLEWLESRECSDLKYSVFGGGF